ncbi:hypothetical protein [Enhygromyxa salina]|uniref:hypothetical protein n=1 Tax=Enhygromyxa salina TaxID=215803 RepID=UPI002468148A|nr:hypothetical protein [Enhygromyxa salina]
MAELVVEFSPVADDLRARGLSPGDRALLVYPPSLEFALAFGGCLWAGLLPVPTYPPQPGSSPLQSQPRASRRRLGGRGLCPVAGLERLA